MPTLNDLRTKANALRDACCICQRHLPPGGCDDDCEDWVIRQEIFAILDALDAADAQGIQFEIPPVKPGRPQPRSDNSLEHFEG